MKTYFGKTRLSKCPVNGCPRFATHRHHILYDYHDGGPVVQELWSEHHFWITRAQSHQARKQHHPLSAKHRWFFWFKLVNGQMKHPRETYLDREWRERSTGQPLT